MYYFVSFCLPLCPIFVWENLPVCGTWWEVGVPFSGPAACLPLAAQGRSVTMAGADAGFYLDCASGMTDAIGRVTWDCLSGKVEIRTCRRWSESSVAIPDGLSSRPTQEALFAVSLLGFTPFSKACSSAFLLFLSSANVFFCCLI